MLVRIRRVETQHGFVLDWSNVVWCASISAGQLECSCFAIDSLDSALTPALLHNFAAVSTELVLM